MATNQLLQSDSFLSGSLAAGWSAWPGLSLPSVVVGSPNVIEPTAVSATDGVYWTGQTFGNDQIVECTINNLASTGSAAIALGVRVIANGLGGHPQGYQVVINATNGNVTISSFSNSSNTTLISTNSVTIANGDVWTFAAIGSVLLTYRNGARINYVTDSNFTGGAPGVFLVANSTAATSAQVSSIRIYSVQQQDGIWTKQGCVLLGTSTEMSGSPSGNAGLSVNFGPSVFLSPGNNVYRGYWVYRNSTTPEISYGESFDGINWSRYSGNPIVPGYGGGVVTWIGNTAYMWGQANPGTSAPNMFTSPDGVTWTNQGATTGLSVSGYGAYSVFAVTMINGTFYALLPGLNSSNNNAPASFLATSQNGLAWTIQNSNLPVLNSFAGCNLLQIGNTYYIPGTSNQPGQNAPVGNLFDPVCAILYQSTDLLHWTQNSVMFQNSLISDSWNNPGGGCAVLCLVNVNGTAYCYYQGSPADGQGPQDYQCMLATAPNRIALSQVVQLSESGLAQTAIDNFASGPGSLSPNWTTPSWTVGNIQIVAGPYAEGNVSNGTRCTALYTGTSFGRNQYCQFTIKSLAVAGTFTYLLLLAQSGIQTAYYAQIPGPANQQTTGQIGSILLVQNGVSTFLTGATSPIQFTPHVGDTFAFSCVAGSDGSNILTMFQNGVQILQAQDYAATLTSGSPGMQLNPSGSAANAQISSWSAGVPNVIPAYPPLSTNRFNEIVNNNFVTLQAGAMPADNYTNQYHPLSRNAINTDANIIVLSNGHAVEVAGDGGLYDTVSQIPVLRDLTNIDSIGT